MIKSLNNFTKSASPITSCPLHTKAETDASGIPVFGISTAHPNLRGNNKKKMMQSIRCHDSSTVNEKRLLQGFLYRRQLLLASTSLPLKPQQMLPAMPPPPGNLKDYYKLANAVQEAQKLNNSRHGSQEVNDVVCLRSPEPLKPPNSRSADQLSAVVAAPSDQELLSREMNEKEVVIARVRRPETVKLRLEDKEEQVVLQGIEVRDDKPLCFDVYIKLGQELDEEEEYVGTFSHMPPPRQKQQRGRHNSKTALDGRHEQKRVRKCCLRLGINDKQPLNVHEAETVIVKLVPTLKVYEDPIKVDSIFIDYS